jgi:hypothetical protein
MSELAAHLVDGVLPPVPIHPWVFTVPVPVRYQPAFDAALTRAVLRVFLTPRNCDGADSEVRDAARKLGARPVAIRQGASAIRRERRNVSPSSTTG